jgi:signal transduction histidine kinase
LDNLLSNAIKYSPAGGPVLVTVAREQIDGGAYAVLAVQDHGVGIPAADLSHIFERFHRASNVQGRISGTGIGLASARQIVEQHGGDLTVRSTEGQGSVFTVLLPLAPTPG